MQNKIMNIAKTNDKRTNNKCRGFERHRKNNSENMSIDN